MIEFISYVPLALITIIVLELCKTDDMKIIRRRTIRGFLSLTLIGVVVTAVAFLFLDVL